MSDCGRRWVPPSTLKRDERPIPTFDESTNHEKLDRPADQSLDDFIFRSVRGILNKLTPEKFEKLNNDILNIGLDSTTILKGVILLIFEKALDEPKYSSMYAQLCKRLAERAPNFDPPERPCTFKRLLLSKCKNEFENRAQLCQHYEKVASNGLTNDEDDAKHFAKRKMLGNIKFIGELGKLQIIQDSILHRCCEQLLVGRKKQPISDQIEDLECFCHLMKTCGRVLDTQIGKSRMDQYFDRLGKASENEHLPLRIRFLIQDVSELRKNKWQTRRVGKGPEGPRTIQQVREDAARDGCIYLPQEMCSSNTKIQPSPLDLMNPFEGLFFEQGSKRQGMDELFGIGGSVYGRNVSNYLSSSVGSLEGEVDSYMNGQVKKAANVQNRRELVRHCSFSSDARSSPASSGSGSGSSWSNSSESHDQKVPERKTTPNGSHELANRQSFNGNDAGPRRSIQFRNQKNESDRPRSSNNNSEKVRNNFDRSRGYGFDRGSYNRANDNDRHNGNGYARHRESYRNNDYNNGSNNHFHRHHPNDYQPEGHFDRYTTRDFPNDGPKDLPPRFKKITLSHQVSSPALSNGSTPSPTNTKDVEVSLRPQQSTNMLFKPKTPSMLPKSAISKTTDGISPLGENSLLGQMHSPIQQKILHLKEPTIFFKQGSVDAKSRKEKRAVANRGPTREEVFKRVENILKEFLETQNDIAAIQSWKENDWLPSKMSQTAFTHLFRTVIEKSESEEKLALKLLTQMLSDGILAKFQCVEAINKVSMSSNLDRGHKALLVAWAYQEEVYTLSEIADLSQTSQSLSDFLKVLQYLSNLKGESNLSAEFGSSNIRLMDFLPESDRTEANLAETLDHFGLTFLMPLLSIRKDMCKQLDADPNPTTFLTWINEHLNSSFQTQPGFIIALFDVVISSIVARTTLPPTSDPALLPEKSLVDAEKDLLSKYQPVLQAFVHENPALQLVAVYALQVFCHANNFPKGMLLRFFVNCYSLDIMDEHAFLQWKEDVNDNYPGKGVALFQVNNWLTWLEEAESEDDDEGDE